MIVKLGSLISEYSVRNKADEDIPVYSVTNEQGFCTGYFSKEVASQDRTTYKIVPRGCFAYNPSRINVGSVDVQECEDRVIVSPLYVVFSVDEKLNRRYLLHYLKSDITLTYIKAYASGSVRDNLKFSILKDFPINLPSAEEQGQIVATLDGIEHLIALRKEEIASLDELVKSRFIELFGDPVYNTKKLPTKRLAELGSLDRGRSQHRPRNAPELLGGPYPLIQTGEVANAGLYITGYSNTYSELSLKQSKMWKAGTLCITIAANIAQTSILTFDACFPDSVVGFIPGDSISAIYMHYWFGFFQKILEEQAPQVAQKNINLKILSDLSVVVPNQEQQKDFIAFVEQTDKSKYFACQTLSFLLKLANNLQSWREKQYDY